VFVCALCHWLRFVRSKRALCTHAARTLAALARQEGAAAHHRPLGAHGVGAGAWVSPLRAGNRHLRGTHPEWARSNLVRGMYPTRRLQLKHLRLLLSVLCEECNSIISTPWNYHEPPYERCHGRVHPFIRRLSNHLPCTVNTGVAVRPAAYAPSRLRCAHRQNIIIVGAVAGRARG
jgi:hypothetical protein